MTTLPTPQAEEPPQDLLGDMLDPIFDGWSGLRHYVRRRRAGAPADPAMDVLLAELLRVNLGPRANVRQVVSRLTTAG